jgi:glycosyltransferase involved in cell wall biosynthesis
VTVVPNGIDPDRFMLDFDRERQKTVLGLGGKIVVGFTGFIRDWHGLERVIDWLSESDSGALVQLVVIGDGPARSALEQYAASRRVQDQVLFTGLVERSDIPLMVSAFDIALQPGVTAYASPLKIMEYMALGCAIVAPRQPNIEEILTDGETALLFDPESPKSMRDCIERLCADRDLRLRLASASRAMILELNLTWDSNAQRLERLFSEALAD